MIAHKLPPHQYVEQKIPALGVQMYLDFHLKSEQMHLSTAENLQHTIQKLVETKHKIHIAKTTVSKDSNTIHFVLGNKKDSYLIIRKLHEKENESENALTLIFDFYLNQSIPQCEASIRDIEKDLLVLFTFDSSKGSYIVQKGIRSKFLLNHNRHTSTLFKNFKFIKQVKSKYQDIRVYESKEFGKVLVIDGQIQLTLEKEDTYTRDIVRNVIQHDRHYDNVLIIGGGDLYIAQYVLNHFGKNIKKLTVCEIDEEVTKIVKEHFNISPIVDQSIANGKLVMRFDDGSAYLKEQESEKGIFDGIIIDNTDADQGNGEIQIAASLFTIEFYRNIHRVLKKGASFSQQLSDDEFKVKFEDRVRIAGFDEITYIFCKTPEYSLDLPIGIVKKN